MYTYIYVYKINVHICTYLYPHYHIYIYYITLFADVSIITVVIIYLCTGFMKNLPVCELKDINLYILTHLFSNVSAHTGILDR